MARLKSLGWTKNFKLDHWLPMDEIKKGSAKALMDSLHIMMTKALSARVERFSTQQGDISFLRTPPRAGGETIVFLHGFCDNKFSFFRSAMRLSKNYQVVIPDLPGFGDSFRNPNANYSIDNYVEWCSDFLDFLEVPTVHLVGNSLGGAFSIETAMAVPNKIATLGIIDAAGVVIDDLPSFYTDLSSGRNIFELQSWKEFEFFLKRIFYRVPYIPWPIKVSLYYDMVGNGEWYRFLLTEMTEGITKVDDPLVRERSLNHRLSQIQLPTFILWGKQDAFFPYQTAYHIHRKISNSRLVILNKMGHAPQVEDDRAFCHHYLTFLRDHHLWTQAA